LRRTDRFGADRSGADGGQQPAAHRRRLRVCRRPGRRHHRIESVEETPEAAEQATVGGGPGYEGLEIRYSFAPSDPVDDPHVEAWIGETHVLQLANSWYPGPRYVEKYGLAEGKTLDAVLKVQTAGTCSPFVVDFPDLDLADDFETTASILPSTVLAELR
jgi:hypothetical protein